MDNPEQLGQHKTITIEQDEQGNVMLWKGDFTRPFALSANEAVDVLHWLYDRRDDLHRLAYPAQENTERVQQRILPEWARKPKVIFLQHERPEYRAESSKPEETQPS